MNAITGAYARDGYYFSLEAMTEAEAVVYRRELEALEAEHSGSPDLEACLTGQCHFVMPFADRIMRRPEILDPVSRLIRPDLLVWGRSFFIKEARSPAYVSWHQDLTYWGLDATSEVTAWVALSPSTVESRAVDVVLSPGQMSLHHGRTFHASHPNRSGERRIGLAIRYVSPDMKQRSGARTAAVLVRGEDRYRNFELRPSPALSSQLRST